MASSFAIFDYLLLSSRLEQFVGKVAPDEVHQIAYLACLLSLYEGNPASAWGYSFASTANGAPFSPQLAEACEALSRVGRLVVGPYYTTLTPAGRAECDVLSGFSLCGRRLRYLEGASSVLLAMPVEAVGRAMRNEPDIRALHELGSERSLLDESSPGLRAIYGHLRKLNQALKGIPTTDPMIPATIWLTYLAAREQSLS